MNKSNYRVHIPDCIIRNENGININAKEFFLYYYLKILSDKQKTTNVQFNHNKFMGKFGVKSNVTFKNMLNGLYRNELIANEVKWLPRHKSMTIQLNEEYIGIQPFTRLHIHLYYLFDKIGYEGIRLMYYYESRINRNKDLHQFCFAGIRLIAKETKVNKNKIKECNGMLKKLKLLEIKRHQLEQTGEYNEFNQEINSRFNNHYTPRLDKLENYKFNSG